MSTEKKNAPLDCGVPCNTPVTLSTVSPGGGYVPGATAHVSPVTPGAASGGLYGVPTLANGRVKPAVAGENDVTLSVNCRMATFDGFVGSAALIRNVNVPSEVGVPLRMPPEDSV